MYIAMYVLRVSESRPSRTWARMSGIGVNGFRLLRWLRCVELDGGLRDERGSDRNSCKQVARGMQETCAGTD